MKMHDRYIQLRDLFEFTAQDWLDFFRAFEELSPVERQTVLHGEYDDYPE